MVNIKYVYFIDYLPTQRSIVRDEGGVHTGTVAQKGGEEGAEVGTVLMLGMGKDRE